MRRFYLNRPTNDPKNTLNVPVRLAEGVEWEKDGPVYMRWTQGVGGGFESFGNMETLRLIHVTNSRSNDWIEWLDE